MYHVTVPQEQLLELIQKNVNELMEENRENFNQNKQVMTPLSSQIAVVATLKILQQLGLIVL